MSAPHLPVILSACTDTKNQKMQHMAISTIQQLSKEEVNRGILCRMGILRILTRAVQGGMEEQSTRQAIIAIYRLVSNDEKRKAKVIKYGLLESLISFLKENPSHNNDSKYWSLLIVHQFCLTEKLHVGLVDSGLLVLLGTRCF
jgi:hypothetical protein